MKMKWITGLWVAWVAVGLVLAPGVAQAAYKETAVANGGTIKGKVTFKGTLPPDAVEKIVINKNPEVCGTGYREVVWIDVKGGALRGAFVFLDGVKEGKKWPEPKGGAYLINQNKCRFVPWAQVVRPGPLTIRHSDKGVLHNINAREMIGVERGQVVKRTIFNMGQPDPGDIKQEMNVRRSPFIAVNCEAHNFMFAYMMAPEHPYAEVVGEDGSFAIKDVPPGTYTVKAWHPTLGLKETKVTVPAKGVSEVKFEFTK